MSNLNKVVLHGNLTADPEMRPTKTGQACTTFSLATNMGWKNKEGERASKTDFHRIVAFGKLGEVTATYLKKGQPVIIQGRLSNSSYTAKDGGKRYVTEVVLQDFHFLPSGKRTEAKEEAVAQELTTV